MIYCVITNSQGERLGDDKQNAYGKWPEWMLLYPEWLFLATSNCTKDSYLHVCDSGSNSKNNN
jgi:hypothetical protein